MKNRQDVTIFKYFVAGTYVIGPHPQAMEILEKVPLIQDRAQAFSLREVTVNAFLLADFPVTNAEFERVFPNHKRCQVSCEDDQPVVDITYFEAITYCDKLGCRLPTSDEWSVAAGGQGGLAAGNSLLPDASYQNFYPSNGTNKKGKYPPSPAGLYDLCGNVLEMTETCISLPNNIALVTVRGGSWGTCKYGCYAFLEGYVDPYIRSNRVGFRVARSL